MRCQAGQSRQGAETRWTASRGATPFSKKREIQRTGHDVRRACCGPAHRTLHACVALCVARSPRGCGLAEGAARNGNSRAANVRGRSNAFQVRPFICPYVGLR